MDILRYNEYEGTADIDMDSLVCYGKILFINDLITYEAESPKKLQEEFEAAVDDYIETCNTLGREPQKPVKGLFQVRISPESHKKAILRSLKDGVRLNETISRAVDLYLYGNAPINHNNISLTINNDHNDPDSKILRLIPGRADHTLGVISNVSKSN